MLPMGSLINHFSRDMAKVDCLAAGICFKMIRVLYGMLLQQAYVMSMVPYSLALCASPLYFAMAYFGSRYHCAVTHLLNSVSQSLSSLHDMLGCNLEAQLSIRSSAFRCSVISKHRRHLCFAAQANYLFAAPLKAWLTFRVTLCTCVLVTGFVLYAILFIDTVGVGTLGLIVSLFFAFLADFELLADLISQSIVTAGAMQRVLLMSENRHERDVGNENKQDQGDIAEKALQFQKSYAGF
jgi:ABC-type multidrug transport system fused ATPase/permease subunit